MALHVLAYNFTRVMNIIGVKPFMAAMSAWEAGAFACRAMPPDGPAGAPDKPEDGNSAAQPQYALRSREGSGQIAVSDRAKAFSRNQDP
jgi:hypothetical protein